MSVTLHVVQDLLGSAIPELMANIRSREVSPVEVVEQHIRRIETVNPLLNAVISDRFEAARREAAAAETLVLQSRDPEELPPLLGIPFTAKDYIAAEGMPLTGGIWSRRHVRAEGDAETIRRLRKAGAILVAKTNVPEGGLWLESYNRIYGRTNNPWDLSRTCGGSSGGDGAIVAAGGVPFALGADVGGSIRIPAAFCGIVGHKPSGRMVPNTGFWPPTEGKISAYLVCGPLTRRVRDVMPLMRVLAGPDGVDLVVRDWELGDPAAIDLEDLVVFPVERPGPRIRSSMRGAIRRASDALGDRGATIAEIDPSIFRRAFLIWSSMMTAAEGPDYRTILGDGLPIRTGRELLKSLVGRSHHTIPALVVVAAESLSRLISTKMEALVAAGKALQAELEAILGQNGVLLAPPYTRPAPRHHGPLLTPFDFVCTGLFNVLEFPSTTVPIGFSGRLPLAVQVVGRRGNDHLTLAVAEVLEQSFGGWHRAEPSLRGRQKPPLRPHLERDNNA
ncbi:MAG TPA: amidase [Nannocystis exedens]|nr:amidase [Nannocystis exedens]